MAISDVQRRWVISAAFTLALGFFVCCGFGLWIVAIGDSLYGTRQADRMERPAPRAPGAPR